MATAYILLAAWVVVGGGILKLYLDRVEHRLFEVSRWSRSQKSTCPTQIAPNSVIGAICLTPSRHN